MTTTSTTRNAVYSSCKGAVSARVREFEVLIALGLIGITEGRG